MLTAKQEVMKLLEDLKDSSTLKEIQYCLYIQAKIQRGMADIEAGRSANQKKVEKRMGKWLAK